jgi:hypothetical protein
MEIEKKLISARTLIETLTAERDQLKNTITQNETDIKHKQQEILDKENKIVEINKEQ